MVIGPGRGPLPLLALGPTVAAATAAVLYTLAAGAVALAACLLLVVGSQTGATHRMTVVALMAVAGVTAAALWPAWPTGAGNWQRSGWSPKPPSRCCRASAVPGRPGQARGGLPAGLLRARSVPGRSP